MLRLNIQRLSQTLATLAVAGLFCCQLSLSADSNNELDSYVVKRGEHLAEILRKFGYTDKNLWGPNGAVAQTLKLNREALGNDASGIAPGTVIRIKSAGQSPSVHTTPLVTSVSVPTTPPVPTTPAPVATVPETSADGMLASIQACPPPPIVEPVYTPPVVIEKETPPRFKSSFGLTPLVDFSSIAVSQDATQSSANFYSKADYGLKLNWEREWGELWSSNVLYQFVYSEFSDTATSAVAVGSHSKQRFEMGLDHRFENARSWSLKFAIGAAQEYFFNSTVASPLTLDPAWIPQARVEAAVDWHVLKHYKISAALGESVLMPINLNSNFIKTGTKDSFDFRFGQITTPGWNWGLVAALENQRESTSLGKQKTMALGFGLQLHYSRGGDEK